MKERMHKTKRFTSVMNKYSQSIQIIIYTVRLFFIDKTTETKAIVGPKNGRVLNYYLIKVNIWNSSLATLTSTKRQVRVNTVNSLETKLVSFLSNNMNSLKHLINVLQ